MTFTILILTYLLYFYECQLLFYGIITFKNYLFHWSVPRNNFYNFFDLFFHLCDLSVITVKLFFFALAFFYIQLYSVFQSQILFFFLDDWFERLLKPSLRFYIFAFIWSLLSYRLILLSGLSSAGTKCFGSSPIITGFTLSASDLLLPLVVVFIIADDFDNVNSFFQLF